MNPYVSDHGKLPRGFRAGSIECRPGQTYRWIIRNRDGATVLCREVPWNSDMVLPMYGLRAALHSCCDANKREA